jgi:putative transposase
LQLPVEKERQPSCEPEHSRLFPVQMQHARNREGFRIGDGCLRAKVRSPCAMPATACRRAYDHRMRDLVCEGRGPRPVVSADVLAMDGAELQAEVLALRRRIRFLLTIVRLTFLLVRLSGFRLDSQRVPDGQTKRTILAAIASAQKAIPLAVALRVLRLPPARFHAWRNLADNCTLDDRASCPHTTSAQLTAEEIATIGSMVQDASFRHMSLRALALHAQRIGRVFAAVSTWARLVRDRGWLRPRRRLYPAKPREGIRASRPNEYWHLDVTVIKLLEGTRTYLHAAIDNFSRRILAWKLMLHLEPNTTCQLLAEAAKHLPAGSDATSVVADSGVENVNEEVNAWFDVGPLRRVLAQVEVSFSNSMIEAWSLLLETRLALPAPTRHPRGPGEAHRLLCGAAQQRGSARGLRRPDTG